MIRYVLRDDQWETIKDLLPGRPGHVGVTAQGNRRFVEAVLYRYRTGIPWRDLPSAWATGRILQPVGRDGRLANDPSGVLPSTPTTNMR